MLAGDENAAVGSVVEISLEISLAVNDGSK